MEITQVRQKFDEARMNRRNVMRLRAEAENLRLSAMGGAIRYDKDKVQTSPENYQEEWLVKAADLELAADRLIASGDKLRAMLYKWMEVCSSEERIVLIAHYINDKTYREIEYEYDEALDYKRYNAAFYIAQRGIEKISENIANLN